MAPKVSPISLPNLSSSTLFFEISFRLQYKNEKHIIAPDYITVQKRKTYYRNRLFNKTPCILSSKTSTKISALVFLLMAPQSSEIKQLVDSTTSKVHNLKAAIFHTMAYKMSL